jgi:hypothetical protein
MFEILFFWVSAAEMRVSAAETFLFFLSLSIFP